MHVDGYVSKKVIKHWLENYYTMITGDTPDEVPGSGGGPKNYDGVSGAQLNKIMLDEAVATLSPLKKNIIISKYVKLETMKTTLRTLNISQSVYFNRLKNAIDDIYVHLNQEKVHEVNIDRNYKRLMAAIEQATDNL